MLFMFMAHEMHQHQRRSIDLVARSVGAACARFELAQTELGALLHFIVIMILVSVAAESS